MSKILLIEDDHNLGLMVKDILEFSNHTVNLLRSPIKAIEILIEESFDLVVLDKLLSGIDGTIVCHDIRQTSSISNIPILMMSALSESEEDCLRAGATNFIYKPFDIETFANRVQATLG
ncbi:response regulator transcription factor [Flavimarina sp. Hel_I_48]|uniref:response regulator transcription factor n=1 Tax=Flavimarina sp. Hel_I_48 TaxID=1392488 RepID=UPI0004DF3674|nr:response regulator [Flavimarina sp. Hel_I_48]